jgi:hypothetical protein
MPQARAPLSTSSARARRWARAALITSALCAVPACVQLLDIERLPVRSSLEAGTPADIGTPDVDADAAPVTCARNDQEPCRPGCIHAFCDDFERDPFLSGWTSYRSIVQPIVRPPGLSSVELVAGGLKGDGRSVKATCTHDGTQTCLAGVSQSYTTPTGVQVAGYDAVTDMYLHFQEVADGSTSELGQVFALLSGEGAPGGLSMSVKDGDVFVGTVGNVFLDRQLLDLVNITEQLPGVKDTWIRVSLYVGSGAGAKKIGYTTCPAEDQVFGTRIEGFAEHCRTASIGDAGFNAPSFLRNPVIILGTGLTSPGRLQVRYDNVQLNLVTE